MPTIAYSTTTSSGLNSSNIYYNDIYSRYDDGTTNSFRWVPVAPVAANAFRWKPVCDIGPDVKKEEDKLAELAEAFDDVFSAGASA